MMQPIVLSIQLFRNKRDVECSSDWSGPCKNPRRLSPNFNSEAEIERSRECLLLVMECLSNMNALWIQYNPLTPKLYDSGVVYRPEVEGSEEWQDIPTTLTKGWGDCEDLACYRIGELRAMGEKATPWIRWRFVDGHYRFHALVKRADGTIEDPSAKLGMARWASFLSR